LGYTALLRFTDADVTANFSADYARVAQCGLPVLDAAGTHARVVGTPYVTPMY
jgi:hypothetical protein